MGYIFDAMERAQPPGETLRSRPQPTPLVQALDAAAAAPSPAIGGDRPAASAHRTDGTVPVAADEAQTLLFPSGDDAPANLSAGPALDPAGIDDRLVAQTDPAGVSAEQFRSIRTGLLARWQNKRHLIHTITSATPQEGKTITSLNLGLSFSELHTRKTIVLEADLRLPQFADLLKLPETPGLVGLLEGQASLAQVVTGVGPHRLHVIAAGRQTTGETVQMLSSPAMIALLKELRRRYDHVIIDTPPVLELADAGILGGLSDEVLMVVRMGLTPRSLVQQAIRTLSSYNAPVTGMIATDQKRSRRHYQKYEYRYRHRQYFGRAAA